MLLLYPFDSHTCSETTSGLNAYRSQNMSTHQRNYRCSYKDISFESISIMAFSYDLCVPVWWSAVPAALDLSDESYLLLVDNIFRLYTSELEPLILQLRPLVEPVLYKVTGSLPNVTDVVKDVSSGNVTAVMSKLVRKVCSDLKGFGL